MGTLWRRLNRPRWRGLTAEVSHDLLPDAGRHPRLA